MLTCYSPIKFLGPLRQTYIKDIMKKVVITGVAGFIGSNLAKNLLSQGYEVVGFDNLQSGKIRQLDNLDFEFINCDISNPNFLEVKSLKGAHRIYHLSADVDNRFSMEKPAQMLSSNVNSSLNVGLAARKYGIQEIVYSSTGTIYGDNPRPPFPEKEEFSNQTTLYGATKYAGESILAVFSNQYGINVSAFRFVGVLGAGYTHGHIFDFVKHLRVDPTRLKVLGDGYQKKSYVNVKDLLAAITMPINSGFEVFNLGRSDFSTVRNSVDWIVDSLNLDPEIEYGSSPFGWVGDNYFLQLDTSKIRATGWEPKFTIEESVRETALWLNQNPWVFD
jgi:UDP-glucose 4-epimerase